MKGGHAGMMPFPRERVQKKCAGTGVVIVYVLAYLAVWIAALMPIIISLPIRVRQISPGHYLADLSAILAAGAIFALLSNPFFGKLSDRTSSRWGMRRPWLIVGAFAGVAGALVIASVPTVMAAAVGWCMIQVAVNILFAVLTAILPDQIPAERRGTVSGYLSACISIAPTAGALIAQQLQSAPLWMFLAPALAVLVTSLWLAIILDDRKLDARDLRPYGLKEFLQSFWVNWQKHPDFGWLWLSRFFRFVSLAIYLSYLTYYVTDHLRVPVSDVPGVIVLSTLIYAIMGVLGANAAGFLSDKTKRRKIFVTGGALIFAAGMLLLGMSEGLSLFYIAVGISGLGQGIFLALDFAIVSDVLPEAATSAAKNLGVFNIANALPQSFAPAFAPFVLAIGGGANYMALFVVAGVASLLGAALVPLIRAVR